MPITPTTNHQAGQYPDTVRHISNGDPANQTFMRSPSEDLEYRSDVLKDFVNALELTVAGNYNTLDAFDKNHDHSGGNGEKVLDFSQIYGNTGGAHSAFSLDAGGSFSIKNTGGAAYLFRIFETAATPKDQVLFPGSDAIFDHKAATVADLTLTPHGIKLASVPFVVTLDALVDGGTTPASFITLNTGIAEGGLYAAPNLLGKTGSDGTTSEGVISGDILTPGSLLKPNVILVKKAGSPDRLLVGNYPVYGLLVNSGTPIAPVWEVHFFVNGAPHSVVTNENLTLIGMEAVALSNTVPGSVAFALEALFSL